MKVSTVPQVKEHLSRDKTTYTLHIHVVSFVVWVRVMDTLPQAGRAIDECGNLVHSPNAK